MDAQQFFDAALGSFDTASIAPGKRFFLRETAQEVGKLYALLHTSEFRATELRPALSHRDATRWEISNSGAERFTYTLTRDDYEAYTARGDSMFLGALRLFAQHPCGTGMLRDGTFGEDMAWITG